MLTSQQLNALQRAFRVGKGMTAFEAQALDAELPGGEQQLEARVTLCGFHRRAGACAQAVAALSRHVAWLVLSWLPELPLERREPAEIERALEFFQEIAAELALAGLERVRASMPDARWWRARGELLLCRARTDPGREALATEAHAAYARAWAAWLAENERTRKQYEADADLPRRERMLHALELSAPFTRVRLLTHLLEAAFEAGLVEQAAAHLTELEPLVGGPVASVAAEARHRTAIAQGRIALRRKDDGAATALLMESTAPLSQSMMLRYAGPDLKLAEELLAQGHRASVIEFLERCEEATGASCPRITEIRQAVEQGEDPDWTPLRVAQPER